MDVPDATAGLLNFDGISYAKGAAALRQLVAWVGEEAFFAGLRRHVAARAYGNATLDDLLAAVSATSGRDLADWAAVWLRQPQVNTLRPRVEVDPEGRYGEVVIAQTAPVPVLRPHRIGVGLFDLVGSRAIKRTRVDVDRRAMTGSRHSPASRSATCCWSTTAA
jgi:aminopeptidase N